MGTHRKTLWFAPVGLVLLLGGWPHAASGAGFAIVEQSVRGLGNAFAGGAAVAEDPSTIYFNPAGLTRLRGQQVILGGHAIQTHFEFENKGSTHLLYPQTGLGLTGDNGGDGGTLGLVPNAYYSATFPSGWAFGLGINAPFGLVTEWDEGWVGRYHALKSDVLTIDINPTVAYRVSRALSLGFGINAMYMSAELSQAVDFGTILAAAGGTPQQMDGKATLNADDWGYGFNVGALWELTDNTRVGIQYRSGIKEKLDGDADFEMSPTVRAMIDGIRASDPNSSLPPFVDTGASGEINLPDTASLSVYHRVNARLALMGDVTWTHWSKFDELKIKFDETGQPDSVTTENWEDAWRFAVGATYNPTPAWPLRMGLAYDQTPIPDKEHRTPRLPDNDRVWLSFGTGYQLADWFSFDVAYTHLFVSDSKIDKDPVGEDDLRGGLKGNFTNSGDIFSLQLAFQW